MTVFDWIMAITWGFGVLVLYTMIGEWLVLRITSVPNKPISLFAHLFLAIRDYFVWPRTLYKHYKALRGAK